MGGLGICGVYVNSSIVDQKGSRKYKFLVRLRISLSQLCFVTLIWVFGVVI
jgi:hypothetical protein